MSEKLQQCQGGWCATREKCAHYWAPKQRNVPPADRLCQTERSIRLVPQEKPEEAVQAP